MPEPLTDEEIVAVMGSNPELIDKFTSEERRRMVRLVPSKTGQSMSAGGYFEQLPGAQGSRWHPPEGSGDELHRPDNSLLGMPPELAVASGLGVGGTMSAVTGAGSKVAAGTKAIAVPMAKYQVTKSALQTVGVPPWAAELAASAVSGYQKGGRAGAPRAPRAPRGAVTAAPAVATEAAAAAAPVASAPVVPEPAVAPSAPASASVPSAGSGPSRIPHPEGGIWSPSRIQSEIGIHAIRQKVQLSEAQLDAAKAMVDGGRGVSPAEAVRAVSSPEGAAAIAAKGASPAAVHGTTPPARMRLSAAETQEYTRLIKAGKSHQQAVESIVTQRALAAKLGTPSSEDVRTKVAERNATGRWPQ